MTPADRLRREAERHGDRNEPASLAALQAAERLDAVPAAVADLLELGQALERARRLASRLGQVDIDEAVGEIAESVTLRRRALQRRIRP